MKKSEIEVGGRYLARVSGKIVTVRVDGVREVTVSRGSTWRGELLSTHGILYDCTNLSTRRKLVFRSAAKFRSVVKTAAQMEADRQEQGRVVEKVQEINRQFLKAPTDAKGSINERLAAIPPERGQIDDYNRKSQAMIAPLNRPYFGEETDPNRPEIPTGYTNTLEITMDNGSNEFRKVLASAPKDSPAAALPQYRMVGRGILTVADWLAMHPGYRIQSSRPVAPQTPGVLDV